MQKRMSNLKKGFTIIEVLIVLAIAGLILLVVFLAVPALQRTSRNTAIKTDVQNILGGVNEYRGANNSANPTQISTSATTPGEVKFTGPTGTNQTSIKVQGSTSVSTTTTVPTSLASGSIAVMTGQKCNGDTAVTTNARSVAAFYTLETASNPNVLKCVDS